MSVNSVNRQIEYFKTGFPFLNIDRPAVTGDGILEIDDNAAETLATEYDQRLRGLSAVKFVPASGAATRMFKELFEYADSGKQSGNVTEVLENIDRFAFADKLREITGPESSPKRTIEAIIRDGLHYGSLPKALILFHKYSDGARTAAEEHLCEGAMYAADGSGTVNIHFTVSPEHRQGFEALINKAVPRYEALYGVKYRIGYSTQSPSTDTIAVNPDNTPFREQDGSLLFRPAGHGALLENLSGIDADIVFIKTVDNVAPDRLKGDTVKYKKALGGLLLSLQLKSFGFLHLLDGNKATEADIEHITVFITDELCQRLPAGFGKMTADDKAATLRNILDRPVRVCGMVRNEGEPGGGPFWVTDDNGGQSLQIAESSQISPDQKHLMNEATHFNPVDIVCGVKDYRGRKFDLSRFTDPGTGFISLKSKDGRELKAQELPGLWNGAMARWNTVFVQVPISTFSPVKIVNDLLRPQHMQTEEK